MYRYKKVGPFSVMVRRSATESRAVRLLYVQLENAMLRCKDENTNWITQAGLPERILATASAGKHVPTYLSDEQREAGFHFLLSILQEIMVPVPSHEDIPNCIVCMEKCGVDQHRPVRLPCHSAHVFGEECIKEWLIDNWRCPICRVNVTLDAAVRKVESVQVKTDSPWWLLVLQGAYNPDHAVMSFSS